MKKFLNNPEDIVQESLEGYVLANKQYLTLDEGTHNVKRAVPKAQGKVKLVIGNGGGHEPGTPGQVGEGLLDLVSLGDVFAAQSGKKLFEAIKEFDDGSPILLTIANHAGDVMNGNLAIRKAKKAGINIEGVVHWDDICTAPKETPEERRGVAGIFFPTKVVGAAAEEGASMDDCIELWNRTRDNTRSVSVALGGGTHPQTGLPIMQIPDDVANIGAGAHGEGGAIDIPFASSKEMIGTAMQMLVDDMPYQEGDDVLLLVTGMGGTTSTELSIVYRDAVNFLKSKGINVYAGTAADMVTTQEACGVTLSLCKADEEIKRLWDAPCASPIYSNK